MNICIKRGFSVWLCFALLCFALLCCPLVKKREKFIFSYYRCIRSEFSILMYICYVTYVDYSRGGFLFLLSSRFVCLLGGNIHSLSTILFHSSRRHPTKKEPLFNVLQRSMLAPFLCYLARQGKGYVHFTQRTTYLHKAIAIDTLAWNYLEQRRWEGIKNLAMLFLSYHPVSFARTGTSLFLFAKLISVENHPSFSFGQILSKFISASQNHHTEIDIRIWLLRTFSYVVWGPISSANVVTPLTLQPSVRSSVLVTALAMERLNTRGRGFASIG